MRERWFGATGRRVPAIVVEGDPDVPLGEALVLDYPADLERLQEAHEHGVPVVVRASTPKAVKGALARPEVACVLVPHGSEELLRLDLTSLTYG